MKLAKKRKNKLTPQERETKKIKTTQESEIRNIFKNLGFTRISNVDGKHINYDGRDSEMDDIFIYENIILITEYTISEKPADHLKNKGIFYNKIFEDPQKFIKFLLNEPKLNTIKAYYDEHINHKYLTNQLIVKVLYCSRFDIPDDIKNLYKNVNYLDYHIVQYFKSLTKVIKRTSKYEFFDFLGLDFNQCGENILNSYHSSNNTYSGHILPENKSSFKEGYKIVSFYIDAESLMKRAYVLRQEGWRTKDNIGYYQRMFEAKKITQMRKHLSEKGRVFINNIISTISEEKIKLYDGKGQLLKMNADGNFIDEKLHLATPAKIEICDECNIIGLIDGQHRTYAYHEGDDNYEKAIKQKRKVQNLLVTGIIFPKTEKKENRLKFEANLFLEINSNQSNVKSQLKQEIELMVSPFSTIAISKRILRKLNENGPLNNMIEQYSFEKGKLKTTSIVSYGLRPLIKIEEDKNDSLFHIWPHTEKYKLLEKGTEEYEILNEYINFCVEKIRDLFIGLKANLLKDQWLPSSPKNPLGIINVTFFNGILNLLRFIIENNNVQSSDDYIKTFKGLENFPFKEYKSSQYRAMGEKLYNDYFKI
ncbi:hypothetical protein V8P49_15395 [Acinetobacter baumannii]